MTAILARPEVRLSEWQPITRNDLALVGDDRTLARELGDSGRVVVEELRAGLRISARSWVGVVRFATFDLIIEPKLAGDHLGLARMIAYTTGLAALRRLDHQRTLAVAAATRDLFDLLALLLVESCSTVARDGFLADYATLEETLPTMRGRLLADRQFTRQFGRIDRLECRFDERETDIAENQILAAALDLCAKRVTDDGVRHRARRLAAQFGEVCDPGLANLRLIRETLVYTRLNARYREAHALAWFLLDGCGLPDVLRLGATRSFAFLLDMNALFEQFVWRVLEYLGRQRGLRVQYQRKDRSILWNVPTNRSHANIILDLLIDQPGGDVALAIDAKYKLYDAKKLGNDDLYQTFLHAFAYGRGKGLAPPQALLISPASQPTPSETTVQIRDRSAQPLGSITALGLHIPTLLAEVQTSQTGPQSTLLGACIDATVSANDAA